MTLIKIVNVSVTIESIKSRVIKFILLLCCMGLFTSNVFSQDEENPSNPLAAVSNIDLKAKYYDLDNNSERMEYSLEGATMLNPKLKLKSELYYWDTDSTGHDETNLESLHLKLIYFPIEGKINDKQPYRLAIGIEWIKDLGDADKGIGTDTDQIAPFVGAAIGVRPGTMVIPLVQHYEGYDNGNVSQTALRLIALQNFPMIFGEKWI